MVTMFVIWIHLMALMLWLFPKTLGGWIADVVIAYRNVMKGVVSPTPSLIRADRATENGETNGDL